MRRKTKENETTISINTKYSKSNVLIGAFFKGMLLENQVIAIGLHKIFNNDYYIDKETKSLVVNLRATEIKKLLNNHSGSFYTKLENMAAKATARNVHFSDKKNETFDYMAIVARMKYSNGILEMRFNSEFKNYIINLKTNFTVLNLTTMLSFTNVYTFRLYEILKSESYYRKGSKKNQKIAVTYNISKLKLELGIIDANEPEIKIALNKNSMPNYDKIVSDYEEQQKKKANNAVILKEMELKENLDLTEKEKKKILKIEYQKYYPSFCEWKVMHRDLIKPIIKEINEIAQDISVDYELQRYGKGAKVIGITFLITIPESEIEKDVKMLSDAEKLEFIEIMEDIIEEPLKTKDLKTIAETAEYDISKIEKAYNVIKSNTTKPDNLIGYLIAAIKNNYEYIDSEPIDVESTEVKENTSKSKTKAKKQNKNAFTNFKQQSVYDFEQLEKDIVTNI